MEKEKESDCDNQPADTGETNQHLNVEADETTKNPPMYFTKDGKAQFGITPPTAFAISYPYPPLPSNLAKNRVLRASDSDETRKESVQKGIFEAEKEFEKEAMPLPGLKIEGSPLPKVLIPEIELALYWDRHPYEFRAPGKGQSAKPNGKHATNSAGFIRRSKSELNLASKVGKLLEEHSIAEKNNSRRSSASASNKTIRSSTVTSTVSSLFVKNDEGNELSSPKNSHYEDHLAFASNGNGLNDISNGNQCRNGKCGSVSSSSRKNSANGRKLRSESGKLQTSLGKNYNANANQSLQMSESERKKFEDIGLFHHHNERQSQGQGGHSRAKHTRQQDTLDNSTKKSTGVQVTIDDVAAAALKSTYLCPLHGQYRRGIERRDKGGFRTDMASHSNTHVHCSRALKGKPSKTKMIKTTETQTEDVGTFPFQSVENRASKRSRTAGHAGSRKGRDVMASEYHGSFKDPYKIAESEKRHLRNKILNYCFTKHSIF